jgi:hypothetical protein
MNDAFRFKISMDLIVVYVLDDWTYRIVSDEFNKSHSVRNPVLLQNCSRNFNRLLCVASCCVVFPIIFISISTVYV